MRKFKLFIVVIAIIVVLVGIYVALIADNVFIYVSNYSWEKRPVYVRTWMRNDLSSDNSVLATDIIFEDSIEHDLTGRDYQLYGSRKKGFKDYEIEVNVNGDNIFKDTISLERFCLVYLTIDSEDDGTYSVAINSYNFRQAWEMNLFFHHKE